MAPDIDKFGLEELKLLKALDEGTASYTGNKFFEELVKNLALVLNTKGAWVTEYIREENRLRALAFWMDGSFIPDYEYNITGTPCEHVIDEKRFHHVRENVIELYPNDPDLKPYNAVSYLGAPLISQQGQILGNLAILDDSPLPEKERTFSLFRIFTARASAELQRILIEKSEREREKKLNLLFNSMMDAVIEFTQDLFIVNINSSAQTVFQCKDKELLAVNLSLLLEADSLQKLQQLMRKLDSLPEGRKYLWVTGGLKALFKNKPIDADATLSSYTLNGSIYYSLILRDISARLEAEKTIHSLQAETNYLREEIFSGEKKKFIIGSSTALTQVLKQADQVACTDATVLITGETGTGKELLALRIHERSRRKEKPFVKLNCAGIPANLIESELFGHEKGAFTGATAKRDGRFSIADKGTLFMDEIGELPIDLQPKLLRVLQEGEYEAVGSSTTRRTDVRIIAATNRDLQKMIREGKFREDLYYRLNIFPIHLPPLRERPEDIVLLAESFAARFSKQYNRPVLPFTPQDTEILGSYHWPGNIRELRNLMERAVILSANGRIYLRSVLTDSFIPPASHLSDHSSLAERTEKQFVIYTSAELRELESTNMIRALEICKGRVSGKNGAAALIDIPPTTFTSRMKALGIPKKKS